MKNNFTKYVNYFIRVTYWGWVCEDSANKGGNASTRPFMDECFFVWRKVQCIKRELEIE